MSVQAPDDDSTPAMVRVRVKSKTGDVYVRAGRHWPTDRWARVEVPLDVAVRLHDDPWLDVRDLAPDAELDIEPSAEGTNRERQLADAQAKVAELTERLRVLEEQHVLELDRLREAHARELSAVTAATTRQQTKRHAT